MQLKKTAGQDVAKSSVTRSFFSGSAYYERVVSELIEIGWDNVGKVDDSLSELELLIRYAFSFHSDSVFFSVFSLPFPVGC